MIFITTLNKRSPDLASALIIHYPEGYDAPKSGEDVTVLGFIMGKVIPGKEVSPTQALVIFPTRVAMDSRDSTRLRLFNNNSIST